MATWRRLLLNSIRTGAVAGVATSLAAAVCGKHENGDAIAPLNAISHIIWGEKAATEKQFSWKYTATGLTLNLAATASWATLYELIFGRAADEKETVEAFLGGAIVSGVAYITDYHLVPARFTPGFEKRLSNRSLLNIYTVLALGLVLGSLVYRQSPTEHLN